MSRRRRGRLAGALRQWPVVLAAVLVVPLVGGGGSASAQAVENDWDWLRRAYNESEPGPGGAATDVEVSGSGLITWTIDRSQVEDRYSYFVDWASGTQQLKHASDRRYLDSGYDSIDAGDCPDGRCSLQIDDFDADLHYAADVTWLSTGWQSETATGRYAPPPRVQISATGEISWWKDRVPVARQSYVLRWVSGDVGDPPRRVSKRGSGYGAVTVAETACDASGTCRAQIPDFDASRAWLVDMRLSRTDDPWFYTYIHRWAGHWPAPDTDDADADGPTIAALSGMSAAAVDGDGTVLDVAWDAAVGADHYLVAYRTGSDAFGAGQQTASTSYRISGLTAGTSYTVQVTAIDTDPDPDATVATGEAQGRTWTQNTAPSFAQGTYQRSITENPASGTAVGAPVAARDEDGDTLTYSLGGSDAGSFSIDTASGQIRTRSGVAYDHETRSTYTVTVTATDGIATAAATVAISIGDLSEPPRAPAAPTVASASSTSLSVTWNAPDNTGRPTINDYDVQYRAGTTGSWNTWPHTGTATTATITDLTSGTAYQVQVRATNAEGTSPWSAAGSGTPTAPSTATALVSNTDQALRGSFSLGSNDVAQAFTTGTAANGYRVTEVGIQFRQVLDSSVSYAVTVHADNGGNPGTLPVATLTAPASLSAGVNRWTHTGFDLDANTTYYVVIDSENGASNTVAYTESDDEDTGAATGWSIADISRWRSRTSTVWHWQSFANAALIQIIGEAKAGALGALGASRSPTGIRAPLVDILITPQQNSLPDKADDVGVSGQADEETVSFVIYYDPDAGAASASRYNQAKALLDEAGISYTEVTGDVYADVLRLTGLSKSIIPRFFLGDPTEAGWTPQIKVNNGGLRWLKAKVAELAP